MITHKKREKRVWKQYIRVGGYELPEKFRDILKIKYQFEKKTNLTFFKQKTSMKCLWKRAATEVTWF